MSEKESEVTVNDSEHPDEPAPGERVPGGPPRDVIDALERIAAWLIDRGFDDWQSESGRPWIHEHIADVLRAIARGDRPLPGAAAPAVSPPEDIDAMREELQMLRSRVAIIDANFAHGHEPAVSPPLRGHSISPVCDHDECPRNECMRAAVSPPLRDEPCERVHELKCWPDYFAAIVSGAKMFELRNDDRHYSVGDVLLLREYDQHADAYSGRSVRRVVTYVCRDAAHFGLAADFAVLSLAAPASPGPTGEREEVVERMSQRINALRMERLGAMKHERRLHRALVQARADLAHEENELDIFVEASGPGDADKAALAEVAAIAIHNVIVGIDKALAASPGERTVEPERPWSHWLRGGHRGEGCGCRFAPRVVCVKHCGGHAIPGPFEVPADMLAPAPGERVPSGAPPVHVESNVLWRRHPDLLAAMEACEQIQNYDIVFESAKVRAAGRVVEAFIHRLEERGGAAAPAVSPPSGRDLDMQVLGAIAEIMGIESNPDLVDAVRAQRDMLRERANVSPPLRDETVPPPGWTRYTFSDDNGVQHDAANIRRHQRVASIAEAWVIYDAEHTTAPSPGPTGEREDVERLRDMLARCVKYAREDRMVTPGVTRLARVLAEANAALASSTAGPTGEREGVERLERKIDQQRHQLAYHGHVFDASPPCPCLAEFDAAMTQEKNDHADQ